MFQGRAYSNRIRCIFSAMPGALVKFVGKKERGGYSGAEFCSCGVEPLLVDARVSIHDRIITATIVNRCTRDDQVRELVLKFECDWSRSYAPFAEVTSDRIGRMHEFYDRVLFGPNSNRFVDQRASNMDLDPMLVIKDRVLAWMRAIDGEGPESPNPFGPAGEVPIEYATILVWRATWRHVFTFPWDVSHLLHQHTTVELREGQKMLKVGDSVTTSSGVSALYNRDSGIEIACVLTYVRDGKPVLDVIYHFMVLGQRLPENDCFEEGKSVSWMMELRTEADVQALLAKPWFRPVIERHGFHVGQSLLVELRREVK